MEGSWIRTMAISGEVRGLLFLCVGLSDIVFVWFFPSSNRGLIGIIVSRYSGLYRGGCV